MHINKDLPSTILLFFLFFAADRISRSECESNESDLPLNSNINNSTQYQSALTGIFGQVAKTVIYGGATLARINSRLLCPLLKHETDRENQDQPILYVFNNAQNKQRAFRIYADDEITPWMTSVAQFNPDQMTFIFVHGWLGGIHNEHWLSQAKNKILELSESLSEGNYTREQMGKPEGSVNNFRPNVIIVEWSDFALGSLYTATQNSLKVAQRLGNLLRQLSEVGRLRPELMHCLGHSIGTHICGQAARYAFPAKQTVVDQEVNLEETPRFGRITGLDPGGFCYELGIHNETTYLGLKPSDALVVDAYYSNRAPFGNKYNVAHYNVRVNNGFFQRNCSVWRNPDVAVQYFNAAVRFTMGSIGNNDILTCDHYFATKFAGLIPANSNRELDGSPSCSYMAYACNSYRNFKRGRCGLCNSIDQCYQMDFEYQRPEQASSDGALSHLRKYSGHLRQEEEFLAGSVKYGDRRVYYMRIPTEEPFCNPMYRLRVNLNQETVDISSFRSNWLRIKFFSSLNNSTPMRVRDLDSGRLDHSIGLHGTWSMEAEERIATGVQPNTLTALFEPAASLGPIKSLVVLYNNRRSSRHDPLANPIEFIQLDYLSSSSERNRKQHSRTFSSGEFQIIYKHLEENGQEELDSMLMP